MGNDIPERKIREAAATLAVSGRAVLCLSAWGILKALHNLLFGPEFEAFRANLTQQTTGSKVYSVVLIIFVLTASDWFYFYIGFSAIAEAHGKQKNFLYTAVAFMLMIAIVIEAAGNVIDWWAAKTEFAYLGCVVVNAISFLITADLWRNAVLLRRSRKELEKMEAVKPNAD